MRKILLTAWFMFLAATLFSADIDYWLVAGFDLATGEFVLDKRSGADNRLISRERMPGHRDLYEKYQLSCPEPVIVFINTTGYRFEWCRIVTAHHGWKFWKWRYYILRDRPVMCGDGLAVELMFPDILQTCDPSVEKAQRIFAETIRLHKAGDREAVGEYLLESYDRLKAEEYLRIAEDDLNKPDRPTSRLGERDREAILRQLVRERDKYPDPLPKYFYEEALRSDYGIAVFEPFFLAEFERAPMPLNALMLALTIRQPEPVFKELYEKKLLDSFVQLSYPEKLPPLPPPLPDGSMVRILPDTDGSGYMENEYQSLPYRERLLQWRCFRGTLLRHFRERLEQLWNTDITVTSGIDLNTGAEYVEKIWRIPGAPFKEIQETKGRFYELHHKYGLAQWKARGIPHRIVVETFVTDLFGNRRANPPGASIRNPAMKFYEILENAPLSPSQAETIWLRVMELWNTPEQLERCLNRKSERGSATPGGR